MGAKKCFICSQYIKKSEDTVEYKGKTVHKKCFDTGMKVLLTEKKESSAAKRKEKRTKLPKIATEVKKGLDEEQYAKREEIFNYLLKINNTESLPVQVYVAVDRYVEQYDFSYEGILNTLKYCFDIQEREIREGTTGIGIVPYFYEEAQDYYKSIQAVITQLEKTPLNYKVKHVLYTPKANKKTLHQINIDEIGGENN